MKSCCIVRTGLKEYVVHVCMNSNSFDVLPPHFIESYGNEMICNSIKSNYPFIFKLSEDCNRSNFTTIKPLLLRCFASLVYHSDALIEVASKCPGHPFLNIPILQEPSTLGALKKLISTEPSRIINSPTGIPPHVLQNKKLETIHECLLLERQQRREMEDKMVKVIENAIEKNALNNGNCLRYLM